MYIPAVSQLEPWLLWWLRNARCNFKATTSVGYYNRISKLDLKDTHIENIMSNNEDMNALLEPLEKLLKFSTENWNKTTWLQDSHGGGLLKSPANLRGRGKFLPVSADICQTKWDTFSRTPPNLDIVYSCLAVMTTLEVMQKEIVLTAQNQVKYYTFKYNTSFSIPSRKILSTCYDATSHLKCYICPTHNIWEIFTCTQRALSCDTEGGATWNHTCSECLPGKIALDTIYKKVQFRGPNLLLLKAMAKLPPSAATTDPSGDPQKKQQWGSVIAFAAEAQQHGGNTCSRWPTVIHTAVANA